MWNWYKGRYRPLNVGGGAKVLLIELWNECGSKTMPTLTAGGISIGVGKPLLHVDDRQ